MNWAAFVKHTDFTPTADACIQELKLKADLFQKTHLVSVFDYTAAVIKSDDLVPEHLWQALKQGAEVLEDVPDGEKDWHPGSEGKVLHPSLWPLVYGKSRILPDRRIGPSDALDNCGTGDVIQEPESPKAAIGTALQTNLSGCQPGAPAQSPSTPASQSSAYEDPYSNSEVEEEEEESDDGGDEDEEEEEEEEEKGGGGGGWDKDQDEEEEEEEEDDDDDDDGQDGENRNQSTESKGWPNPTEERADAAKKYTGDEGDDEEDEDEERDPNHVSENKVKRRDWRWFYKTHPVNAPEPRPTYPAAASSIIVKLANIHLTPEKPSYDGGSWHVEGLLNEHICATALFCHDNDNITDSHLDLRTQANREGLDNDYLQYEQDDWRTIQRTFAIGWPGGGSTVQNVGSVLQHHVAPFRLADPARRGHRKILALFLVDSAVPVISTAKVPSQQEHWWLDRLALSTGRLPPELTAMMLRNVEFPHGRRGGKGPEAGADGEAVGARVSDGG
ncbi:hypothetical protein J3458_015489 [Metarhizium acridum]|uniref:uncharacterized protein n=1 Tax=Metarhizium acridum TaxID=92637 RepID=UPI001C6BA377|nr:hypothetical protein J3458_015489 [Metarhizium acridum]